MRKGITFFIILGLLVIAFWIFSFNGKTVAPVVEDSDIVAEDKLDPQVGLPPAVEAKRQAIYAAALAESYEQLAGEAGSEFNYSFGGEVDGSFLAYLQNFTEYNGQDAFEIIKTLLVLPYGLNGNLYTWPSVFTIEPSIWTEQDVAMMKTFLTDEQIEEFRQFGGYMYYRIGITSVGEWTFFVAGD